MIPMFFPHASHLKAGGSSRRQTLKRLETAKNLDLEQVLTVFAASILNLSTITSLQGHSVLC